jgi:hypothetical protein
MLTFIKIKVLAELPILLRTVFARLGALEQHVRLPLGTDLRVGRHFGITRLRIDLFGEILTDQLLLHLQ